MQNHAATCAEGVIWFSDASRLNRISSSTTSRPIDKFSDAPVALSRQPPNHAPMHAKTQMSEISVLTEAKSEPTTKQCYSKSAWAAFVAASDETFWADFFDPELADAASLLAVFCAMALATPFCEHFAFFVSAVALSRWPARVKYP